ncbi:MAG: DUF1289 domain-containing protein [Methylovirgula sp.]
MIPSPCIGVCRIRPSSDFCIGCARSRDEIASWPILTDDQRAPFGRRCRIVVRRWNLAFITSAGAPTIYEPS